MICGLRSLRTSPGFKVQIISSAVFLSKWFQCLSFEKMTTWWFPGVAYQTAKSKGSVECTPASQTGVLLLPLWSHYTIPWHDFQQTLQEECPLLEKGPDPKSLGKRRHLSNFHILKYLHFTASNYEQSRDQSAELSVEYILQWLPKHDAQAKHFQTLDHSHVPTHV